MIEFPEAINGDNVWGIFGKLRKSSGDFRQSLSHLGCSLETDIKLQFTSE